LDELNDSIMKIYDLREKVLILCFMSHVNPSAFAPIPTADGSFTFFSDEFNEAFHSQYGARQEAECKFVQPAGLAQLAQQSSSIRLLDICYGLGYNTAEALAAIWRINLKCRVEWVGLELDKTVPQAAIAQGFLNEWPTPVAEILAQVICQPIVESSYFSGQLRLGDARQTIQSICQLGFQADAVFLDPFSPPHCPQLWTVEFLSWVARCLKPSGKLLTYSCSAAVRSALQASGLQIGSTVPVGRRSPGTVASFKAEGLPPLSQQEQEHLKTAAAVPYRDPTLEDSAEIILKRRQLDQQKTSLERTSQWKKRWWNYGL
jgi:tRNA U34 5-methylaminomethyl-2-thiouridine-forming methyltransferase MnmC